MSSGTERPRLRKEVGHRPLLLASAADAVPLYLGFAATGVCVALPGAVLPLLLSRWHMDYEGGGKLFLCAWIGSAVGALLVSGSSRTILSASSAALASAMLGVAFCGARTAWFWMFLFGTALGAAMTSITLIRQVQTRYNSRDLVFLNLMWATGACATPALAVHALRSRELRPILYPLALLFALLALWACFGALAPGTRPDLRRGGRERKPGTRSPRLFALFRKLPGRLILLVVLTTGVEASFGGWLATYTQSNGSGLAQIVAAPTCFWGGLLLSRLVWSLCTRVPSERWIVRGSLILIAAASLLLLLHGRGRPLLLASAALGFGVGPTYPLLLGRTLRVHADGAIFFLSGVASACLPWLTGVVSTQRGSLRAGLLVPILAAALMVVLSFTLPLLAAENEAALPAP